MTDLTCQREDLSEGWGRREIREIWSLGKIQPTISGFEGEWPQAWEDEQPLEAESSPQGQPARQKGPQSYNHMEMNSANNLNELQSGFFPKPLDKNPAQLAPWF